MASRAGAAAAGTRLEGRHLVQAAASRPGQVCKLGDVGTSRKAWHDSAGGKSSSQPTRESGQGSQGQTYYLGTDGGYHRK